MGAKESIVEQLSRAQDFDLDVIICGRGGGSIEDLWAFNEEIVARAIYASNIPVISAVGHEIDFTIADFVADLRAPTPTGAAEMAVPNLYDLETLINQYRIRLNENIKNIIIFNQKRIDNIKNSYVLKNPLSLYEVKEQKLDNLLDRTNNFIISYLRNCCTRLDNVKNAYVLKNPLGAYEPKVEKLNSLKTLLNKKIMNILDKINNNYNLCLEKLNLLNPLNVLQKGYSLVTLDGVVIKSSKDLKVNNEINIRMHEGNVNAIVKEIK